jgi:uroporphyrinogen III methyltransferase / synthase
MSLLSLGKVYLIGAGPGDPGLITVRGAELIGHSDVVLYDGLANEALLSYAPEAEKICVGKHGHGGSWSQNQIDDEVVRFAKLGKTVARLKGGDTAVFARTAEEVDRLVDEGIEYEIVPGITAALAASAYAGIPITHRDWSSAVALVTGQLQPADGSREAEETLDWNALARFPGTLVMYMGINSAGYWSSKLISEGKSASTPVALIRRCSWPDQQVVQCDLGSIASTLQSMPDFRPPIISVVGEVLRMSKCMNWFSKRPWFGKKIWITSPQAGADLLACRFNELGAQSLVAPVLQFASPESWLEPDAKLTQIREYDWIVFSSSQGVLGFFERLKHLGLDGRSFPKARLAAVGIATAKAVADHGMICDMVPQTFGMEALTRLLIHDCKGKRFAFVRCPTGESIGMEQLANQGALVDSIETYEQIAVNLRCNALLMDSTIHFDAVTATSKRIAELSVEYLGEAMNRVLWLSLSESVSQRLQALGCNRILTAERPTFESLAKLCFESFD